MLKESASSTRRAASLADSLVEIFARQHRRRLNIAISASFTWPSSYGCKSGPILAPAPSCHRPAHRAKGAAALALSVKDAVEQGVERRPALVGLDPFRKRQERQTSSVGILLGLLVVVEASLARRQPPEGTCQAPPQ